MLEDEEACFEFTLEQLLSIEDPANFVHSKCRLSYSQKSQLGYFNMQSPLPLMVRLLFSEDLQIPKEVMGKGIEFLRQHDVNWQLKTVQLCEPCLKNILETYVNPS